MPRRKHYLSGRANWQHEGLKKASKSEKDVFAILDEIVDPARYIVDIKPTDAAHIYMDKMHILTLPEAKALKKCGIVPELSIMSKKTEKKIFLEVKHQQDAGNAHERAGKYFAPGIVRRLQEITGVTTFPVFFIFVGGIVDGPRSMKYRAELSTWFDDPATNDRVLLWYNRRRDLLQDFFENCIRPAIDDEKKNQYSKHSKESGSRGSASK